MTWFLARTWTCLGFSVEMLKWKCLKAPSSDREIVVFPAIVTCSIKQHQNMEADESMSFVLDVLTYLVGADITLSFAYRSSCMIPSASSAEHVWLSYSICCVVCVYNRYIGVYICKFSYAFKEDFFLVHAMAAFNHMYFCGKPSLTRVCKIDWLAFNLYNCCQGSL